MKATISDKNLYYVGGVVRDELLGVESHDIDLCYEGNAIEFAKEKGFDIIRENPAFGTIRINYQGEEIDLASTRSEFYPQKGHLPVVLDIGVGLEKDLYRRDFTMNALAKNTKTGEVVDFFGGVQDIKEKKIKILHDRSFYDDPTRIVRAFKFSIRFGFVLDDYTLKCQDEYLSNINYDMSYHRLKKELKETFSLRVPCLYEKFVKQGLYMLLSKFQKITEPMLEVNDLICEYNPNFPWLVYLGTYDLSNFELTKSEVGIINGFKKLKASNFNTDYDIYKTFQSVPLESVLIYTAFCDKLVGFKYLRHLSKIKLNINGDDLLHLGIPTGSLYNEIFENILKSKINGDFDSRQSELDFVKRNYLNLN